MQIYVNKMIDRLKNNFPFQVSVPWSADTPPKISGTAMKIVTDDIS